MFISTKTTMLIKLQVREKWLISLTRPLCIICQPFSVEGSREQERNWFHNSERLLIKLQSRRIYSGAFNGLGRMCHRLTEFTWASTNLLSEMLLQYSEQGGTSGGQTVRNSLSLCWCQSLLGGIKGRSPTAGDHYCRQTGSAGKFWSVKGV